METAHPYAEIFEVEDIDNNRERKVLKILLRADYTHLGELFQQEATILTSLIHSGIPRAEEQFSVLLSNGQELRCLVMEKIAEQNLEQWLKQNQKISQEQAINWLKQLVKILDYVHQEGFFHRDIKPSNIMRKLDGQLVLIDFGTARKVTETVINGSNVTVVYSDGYTAVEQIQGRAVLQSDFFAIGRTFVYLLTGKHPNNFSIDSQTNKLVWRDSAPQVSQSFADLIDKLMDLSVQNRPKNTQAILQLIDNLDKTTSPPPHRQASRRSRTIAGLFFGLLAVGLLKWHISTSPSIPQIEHQDNVNAVAFSPDGKYLATASLDCTAQVWNISSHREVVIQHKDSVVAIAFSPNGKYLATASLDGTAKILEMASGKITATLNHKDGVVAVAFSRDGEIATASADGTAQVWTTSGKPVGLPLKHSAYVRTVTFSPDGKHLATASLDNTARVWEITSNQEVKPVGHPLEHKESVLAVAFSPDGKKLATASADGIAKMWEVPSGKLVGRPLEPKNSLVAVVFSPDGKKLATVSADGTAQFWNTTNGSEILPLRKDNVNAIAFSPTGKYLAIARRDNNTTRVLEQKGSSYQEVACQQHKDRVVAVTFSSDSKYLATASWDNTARVWAVISSHAIGCQK